MSAAVGGRISSTKIKIAFSGASLIRFLLISSLLERESTSIPDDIDELTNSQILLVSQLSTVIAQGTYSWNEVFLLIDSWDITFLGFLTDYLIVSSSRRIGRRSLRGSCRGISDGFARLLPYVCLL
jgi:hypothetical protein